MERVERTRWTPEEDEALIKLYKEGWAYSEIAARINKRFNRQRTSPALCQRWIRLHREGRVKTRPRGIGMVTTAGLEYQGRIDGKELTPNRQVKIVKGPIGRQKPSATKAKKADMYSRKPSYPAQLAKLAQSAETLFNVVEIVRSAAADNRTIHDLVEDLAFLSDAS